VLPLQPGAKVPATTRGLHDASLDLATIDTWWSEHPECNLGLRTGVAFDVLDVDGDEGVEELARNVHEDYEFSGPIVLTPHGGLHIYFQSLGLGNRTRFRPGLDWRGDGGYVVAPPSRLETGPYNWWVPTGDRCLDELPAAPAWLLRLLERDVRANPLDAHPFAGFRRPTNDRYALAALEAECQAVAHAPAGTRNHTLNKAAFALGRFVATGTLHRDAVEQVLLAAARDAGLSEREALLTIRSGLRGREVG
jgi:hypothetical protein